MPHQRLQPPAVTHGRVALHSTWPRRTGASQPDKLAIVADGDGRRQDAASLRSSTVRRAGQGLRSVTRCTAATGPGPLIRCRIRTAPGADRPGARRALRARRPRLRTHRPWRRHYRDHACRRLEDGAHGRPLLRRRRGRAGRRRQVPMDPVTVRGLGYPVPCPAVNPAIHSLTKGPRSAARAVYL